MQTVLSDPTHRQGYPPNDEASITVAAIKRNNAAVRLLVSGAFPQAMQLFKESITHIVQADDFRNEVAITTSTGSGAELMAIGTTTASQPIERSSSPSFTSASPITYGGNSPPETLATSATRVLVESISSEYDPATTKRWVDRVAQVQGCRDDNTHYACPMRIDHVEHSDDDTTIDLGFVASVLLYNYGVAFSCLAAETIHGCEAKEYRQGKAYHLFSLANVFIFQQFREPYGLSSPLFAVDRLLQLKAFLSHSQMQACIQHNLHQQAELHAMNLNEVTFLIQMRERLFRTTQHNVAVAA